MPVFLEAHRSSSKRIVPRSFLEAHRSSSKLPRSASFLEASSKRIVAHARASTPEPHLINLTCQLTRRQRQREREQLIGKLIDSSSSTSA